MNGGLVVRRKLIAAGVLAVVVAGASGSVAGSKQALSPSRNCASSWPFLPSKPLSGAAGTATSPFALFRRSPGPKDHLRALTAKSRHELGFQLENYDPTLIRRVSLPQSLHSGALFTVTDYVIVGQGSAPELQMWSCLRTLTPSQRRKARKALASLQALAPSGPTFCFVSSIQPRGRHESQVSLRGGGPCSTFADVSAGYALTQIDQHEQPQFFVLAGLVPDGVARVVLRYHRHAPVRARVSENVYWARVPRSPPLGSRPMSAAALRKTILNDLPSKVVWLGPDKRIMRAFSPTASDVRLLMRRYQACVAIDCGA